MRVTVLAMGSRGDVVPYLALALGLRSAGCEVRFAAYTNFEAEVRARGLEYVPVLGDYRDVLSGEVARRATGEETTGASDGGGAPRVKMEETGRNPLLLARHFIETMGPLMRKMFADCLEASRGSDAVLCSAIGFFAAYHVAEKLRVPLVPAFLQPVHPTRRLPCMPFPEAPGPLAERASLRGGYNLLTYWLTDKALVFLRQATERARREALGLPPMSGSNFLKRMIKGCHPCLYGFSPTVLSKPPDWGDHLDVTGYWFLDPYEGWRPPEGLEHFLESGPAPVCVGFGSMNERDPEETTRLVLEALALAGRRGILLTGWGGLSNADLPDDVYKAEEVPHDWLFPRVSAAVHHGGAGTTAASLRAGTPTVVVPFIGDQAMWGRRVHDLGAGPEPIPRRKLSAKRLAEAIRVATADDTVRKRAAAVGERVESEDGVGRAVETFLSRVADRRA